MRAGATMARRWHGDGRTMSASEAAETATTATT
jgi:hypothetical protein